ncbi:hypothetical protein RRG08_033874 [Elysia crispata]|uniref:Uncharacterized protein n=1 Tax=Elysia crispata TaxID=231223 RepID=A0AAE1ED72_9GAST|nr:hypothetical protein RRG08_033874 [Elysia crispata]
MANSRRHEKMEMKEPQLGELDNRGSNKYPTKPSFVAIFSRRPIDCSYGPPPDLPHIGLHQYRDGMRLDEHKIVVSRPKCSE